MIEQTTQTTRECFPDRGNIPYPLPGAPVTLANGAIAALQAVAHVVDAELRGLAWHNAQLVQRNRELEQQLDGLHAELFMLRHGVHGPGEQGETASPELRRERHYQEDTAAQTDALFYQLERKRLEEEEQKAREAAARRRRIREAVLEANRRRAGSAHVKENQCGGTSCVCEGGAVGSSHA